MKKITLAIIYLSSLLLLLSGCASGQNSASLYSSQQAQREQTVRLGTVVSVKEVTIDAGGEHSGLLGALGGGALGAVAGSTVGGGSGQALTTIGGGIVGAIAGNTVEKKLNKTKGLEIIVRLEGGGMRAITQNADETFKKGDRVRLLNDNGITRVTHDL